MRKLLALVLTCMMLLSLAACASTTQEPAAEATETAAATETTTQAPEATASEPVSLTFWYWADTTEQSELMQSIVAEYNATNGKNITVTAEENAWNGGAYVQDMYVAVAGGGGPDISTFRFSGASMYYNGGYLYNLTDYVNNWADKSTISDSIWNAISASTATEGEYYCMPWTYETLYVYYRPSMFAALGIEVPQTYEEFMAAIQKCTQDTNGDGVTDVYGLALRGPGGQESWYYFLNANGATFDDLTSPEAIKGMEAFKSIYTNGWAPSTAPTDGYSEIMAEFKSGKAAMVIHHIGSHKDMIATFGDDVAAFTLPKSEAGYQWDAMTDTDLIVLSSTKNPDACFDFAKFMSTGKGQEMWFEGTGKSDMNTSITSRDDFKNNPFLQVCLEGMDHAGTFPFTPYASEFISTTWAQTTQQILLGQISVEDGMATYQKALFGE